MEKSIEIKAPPEKVWEMLALERLKEWIGAGDFAWRPPELNLFQNSGALR